MCEAALTDSCWQTRCAEVLAMPSRGLQEFLRPAIVAAPGYSSFRLCDARKRLKLPTPVSRRVEDVAHLVTTATEAIELSMLELDARTRWGLHDEPHLDLGFQRRIILPVSCDVPG